MKSLMNSYSDEEFQRIVLNSTSYSDCLQQLGYSAKSGDLINTLKKKIQQLNINIEHFNTNSPIVRNESNIFIKNSSACQKTLRNWYKKGEYSEYKCSICGQEPLWNGKELTLILDHINGYNHDNRLENLRWVCPNCNMQLDTTNGKNINHNIHKINYCIDCGKIISNKATRCSECEYQHRVINNKMRVTRDELKELIRTTSFVQIGKQFNVSDNAVRKWCDKYNLPRKISEIKKYSDDEWSKI